MKVDSNDDLQAILNKLCKDHGYDYAKHLGMYKDEDIWEPAFKEECIYGYPVLLHVKKGRVRQSRSYKEVFKILAHFYD